MAILHVTLHGLSGEVPISFDGPVTDESVRRVAIELLRAGQVPGLHLPALRDDAFAHYVVDRFNEPAGGLRLFLRPKVPFGRA